MALGPIEDLRPQYAAKLRKFADMIESTPKQPRGIGIQLFWNDTEVTTIRKIESGYNTLAIAGLHLRLANEEAIRRTFEESYEDQE